MDWKPLILKWLEEARQAAQIQANKPNGSRYKLSALNKAIESINQHEGEIVDVVELTKLPRVGEKTVNTLKTKIKSHCAKNPDTPLPESMSSTGVCDGDSPAAKRPRKVLSNKIDGQMYPFAPPPPPKRRDYIPKYGSAPYHVLITMRANEFEDPTAQGIGQSELQRLMKPRTSGVLEGAVSRPTPAIGMALKTLKDHDCVYVQNGRWFLDEIGRDLASRLMLASGDPQLAQLIEKHQDSSDVTRQLSTAGSAAGSSSSTATRSESPLAAGLEGQDPSYVVDQWAPGTFVIKLLIDNREVASKNDRGGLVNDLRNMNLDLDVQALSVGDCLWVAEHVRSGRRAVLDWIVERKTLGDLRSSIHDGRYHDQKKRLARSTIPHIIYLVEIANNMANNEMFKDNHKKFITAMSQTVVKPHFRLKLTRSQNETVQYIAKMTDLLGQKILPQTLNVVVPNLSQFEPSMAMARSDMSSSTVAIDFSAFHEALQKSKLRTVGETFRLMLRTIKGVSAEKATAVQRIYPTPSHLRRAYEKEANETRKKELVYQATKSFVRRQQLRMGLSEAIYEVWGNPGGNEK